MRRKKMKWLLGVCVIAMGIVGCSAQAEKKPMPEESSRSADASVQEETESSTTKPQEKDEPKTVSVCIEPGDYVTEIAEKLVAVQMAESVEMVLDTLETMDRSSYRWWSAMDEVEPRAFVAEGYLAPGIYELKQGAKLEEVLAQLLEGWDALLTEEMQREAAKQGYTMDEILTMASIVEWESAVDPTGQVKPQVAAVVRNRVESESALQMDVTIFYLQEALEPYRKAEEYEAYYDTYERSTLPAGPIGSPSLESVQAVLKPALTDDLFFVYDDAGNYYFAADYEEHLVNCETAGIY